MLKGSVLNTATATGDKIKDPKSDEPKEPNGGDEVETPTFAPITIKPKDVTATYNGAAITGKDVEITSGKLLEGHKLSAAVIGSGVNAGSYELTPRPGKDQDCRCEQQRRFRNVRAHHSSGQADYQ